MPLKPIEDEQLKDLLKNHIKPFSDLLMTYQILFSQTNYIHKIDKHTHDNCLEAASFFNNQTLTDKKGIGWESKFSSESNFIATRFAQQEAGVFRITIYSENPDIESATYSIDQERQLQKVDLLHLDVELLRGLQAQETNPSQISYAWL